MGKLKIGKIIEIVKPNLTYEVSIQYMHGDADKYETQVIFIKDESVVTELIEILETITKNTKRNRSKFLKEYPQFFDEEFVGDFRYNDIFVDWPGDCTCNNMYPAAFDGYEIAYFDDSGNKYRVEYRKDKNE